MHTYRFYVLLFFVVTTIAGCNNRRSKEASVNAFIGGQIINPTSDHVVILKDNNILDTVYLDKKNRFGYSIENAENGLYLIKHSPERQTFYLEAGDSLLLRANSLQFDESLHFSGTGSEKNNFLIETFLLNANNTDLILSYYKIRPEEFAHKTDSIKNERLNILAKRNSKYKFSDNFLTFADKSIRYDCADLRERYTYMVNKYYKEFSRQTPEGFHEYRNKADFNDSTLQTNPSYIRFIENYLINQAMTECAGANLDSNDCYDLYDHRNITTRIKLIDSLTDLPLVKEHFFSKFGSLGIIMARERDEIVSILELLKEKGYPEDKLKTLIQTGNLQLAYLPGMNLGNIDILDINGDKKVYREIASNKPTIIFLWSIYSPENHKRNHQTIRSLRKKYPEINFLAVNIDSGETSEWINTVNKLGYDETKEFQLNLQADQVEKNIFQNYLNKSLFVDASGEVITGDAYINSPDFETRILEFLNR